MRCFTQKVFDAIALPFASYSKDPDLKFQAKLQTERAFRDVIGYRLYHDLRRGWRVTSPNLEQCGLLEINYLSLDELARMTVHPGKVCTRLWRALRQKPGLRWRRLFWISCAANWPCRWIISTQTKQETIQQQSSQRLITPWALDENELLEHAATLYPRSTRPRRFRR